METINSTCHRTAVTSIKNSITSLLHPTIFLTGLAAPENTHQATRQINKDLAAEDIPNSLTFLCKSQVSTFPRGSVPTRTIPVKTMKIDFFFHIYLIPTMHQALCKAQSPLNLPVRPHNYREDEIGFAPRSA